MTLTDNKNKKRFIELGILLAVLIIAPNFMDGYSLQVTVYCGIFIILASSLNLLIGYTGIFSMGHAAFYCLGAYTSALLATKAGMPFVLCFLAGGMVAGIAGFIIGIATLRLNDLFLTFSTLGLSEVVRIIIQNADFTNGALGITGIPMPEWFGRSMSRIEFYYFVLVLTVLTLVFIYNLVNSNTGRTLKSIRDDANAASSLGINVFSYKMKAMIISCFIAGLAGSLYASFIQYINAANFSINVSINIVAMVAIGGMGTITGPIVGAVILQVLPEIIRFLQNYRQLLFGVALVVSVMFAPQGIMGIIKNYSRKIMKTRVEKCQEKER